MTGDELARSDMPARSLGIFAPPLRQADADDLARMMGAKIGALTIPPIAVRALAETIAVMVMFPEAPGLTGAEILAESKARWASADVRAKADSYAEKYGVEEKETGLALLQRVMDPILREIGDRNVPHEANSTIVEAMAYIIAAEVS